LSHLNYQSKFLKSRSSLLAQAFNRTGADNKIMQQSGASKCRIS